MVDANDVTQSFDTIIQISRKLRDILEKEKRLLTQHQYDNLNDNALAKRKLVDALDAKCNALKSCFSEIALPFNRRGLNEFIESQPSSSREDLSQQAELMLSLLKEVEKENQVNGVLLVSRHNYNQKLLSIITQTNLKSDTYGRESTHKPVVSTKERQA